MGRIKTIARRTFLISSAAIIGGVAFGTVMYRRPGTNPLLEQLGEGEAALTPYVLITAQGITLITPRADMGQGTYSMQATLIAEELDVRLDQITADPGMPNPIYYNTAMGADAAPFRSTDAGFMAESTRSVMDAPMKFMGIQVTGGSTSVPDGYEKLRMAGAVARETLKAAASQKTGIPVDQLSTSEAAVHLPDGSALSYIELGSVAADIDPVTDVTLRDTSAWGLIGKPLQRIDIVAKSTGTQTYGIDQRQTGMVHAAVRLHPGRGEVIAYDTSLAETMRGVLKIVPITGGIGVIADNSWRAMQAAQAIEPEWGESQNPAQMEDHWQALEAAFTPDHIDSQFRDDGDVDEALTGPDIFTAEYRTPYLAHAPLEPINATVLVTNTRVDIWTGTQIPSFVKRNAADLSGIDPENVYVHMLMIGGSFGHRLEDGVVRQATELAMAMKGTPVKLTYSREEDFAAEYPRQIAMARGRGRVQDGKVTGFDLGISMPAVVASQMGRQGLPTPGPDLQIVAGAWDQPFNIPNYRVTGYRAPGLAPVSSWRSVGASSNGFFHDCFLDELIHKAGADPMEERLRLCWHTPSLQVLEAVAEMSNWGSELGENRGRGVALCLSFGVPCAQVIEVSTTKYGIRIDNVYAAADVGRIIDPVNFDNQMKGGVVFGLAHAMNCEITYADGIHEQDNFHVYEGMRLYQCPQIEVRGLENADKIRGIGEPPVPPAAPALANAIFDATGQRIRELPLSKHIDFA